MKDVLHFPKRREKKARGVRLPRQRVGEIDGELNRGR